MRLIASSDAVLRAKLKALAEQGFTHAIINTTAAAHILPQVRAAGIDPIVRCTSCRASSAKRN